MYLIRETLPDDATTLLKLAKMVHFINLPADKEIISGKIARSATCFEQAASMEGKRAAPRAPGRGGGGGLASAIESSELFMFALEDTETGSLLGTSQLVSSMGGPGAPNVSFQLERREKFSSDLQVGTTQMVARLYLDETGPTEIGGLILQPSFRGHKRKLGRFLSLVRFHFIGLHRRLFADRIVAEMMAPITPDGRNTLWEYLGRRFIPLSYEEADRFCQHSKEFMTSLLPRDEIYLSLLPAEARRIVGQVGPETAPARRMLEKLGFASCDRIDPFDGGPHLEAMTDEIELVASTRFATVGASTVRANECTHRGILSVLDQDGGFRALEEAYRADRNGKVSLTRAVQRQLEVEPGGTVGLTPTDAGGTKRGRKASSKARGKTGRAAARA